MTDIGKHPMPAYRIGESPQPAPGLFFFMCKRVTDVIGGLMMLIMVTPVLLLCITLIKLADPGPAIFSQWRVGKDGKLFRLYKLRSMYQDSEKRGAAFASRGDNRVIEVCRWMRISHVDELPQLWNVIKGEMSLVGPRPERPEILLELHQRLPEFQDRLVMKPGITGLAQITSGYANTFEGMMEKLKYDKKYIQELNLITEYKILFQTISRIWDVSAN